MNLLLITSAITMSVCPLNVDSGVIKPWGKCAPSSESGFLKSLQFSPDGLCTLSATECNNAVVGSLNGAAMRSSSYYGNINETVDSCESPCMQISTEIPVGEAIYDLRWYPGMQYNDSASKCFISTSRDHPIMLWDAGRDDGKAVVRCTYRGYDLADELDAAISLTFNLTGDKIYAGYERMIRCFDVATPGRRSTQYPTSVTKRARQGQKGLISSLAFNPDYSGAYAAGSYAHSVGIYVENMPECALLFGNIECGVTCLKWSPCGHYLWVGGRNNDNIHCYDIRTTQSIVGTVQRKLSSNQRMTFDIDPWGKYLCTGDQDGQVLFYDTSSFELVHTVPAEAPTASPADSQYSKCVNSVAFHPFSALLGVARGERTFAVEIGASDSDSEDERDTIGTNGVTNRVTDSSVNMTESVNNAADVAENSGAVGACNGASVLGLDDTSTCIRILQLPYTPIVLPVPAAEPVYELMETSVLVATDGANDATVEAGEVVVEMAEN